MGKFIGVQAKSKGDPKDRPLTIDGDGNKAVLVSVELPLEVYQRLCSLATEEQATVEDHIDAALVQWVDDDAIAERAARTIEKRAAAGESQTIRLHRS